MELETNMETAYVGRVIQEGLSEEVTFRQGPTGCAGSSHVKSCRKYGSCQRRVEPKEVRTTDKDLKRQFSRNQIQSYRPSKNLSSFSRKKVASWGTGRQA